jgi:biopolymer transport protein ExbD
MRFSTRLKPSYQLIDLAPLVDVIFLLLIFFIITSDILPLKTLQIENPSLNKDSIPLTTQLALIMDEQHVLYLGSKKKIVEFETLKKELLEEIMRRKEIHGPSDFTLVLSVDKNVDYGTFLRLYSIVQECCPKIRLAYKYIEG